MKGNCMGGCKHCLVKSLYKKEKVTTDDGRVMMVLNEFVGYENYCDKDPKAYADWHERNKDNTYEVYKNDCIDCFEPTEITASLNKMIEISEELLEKIKTKENG